MEGQIDLTAVWAVIIAFGIVMYVLMDGFDLGVGILFPFAPGETARDELMTSVAPVWDGNETWLVLGGAGLLGAFPLVYTILLPALYIGVFLLLTGLIFRGVAFEFRFKATRHRYLWDAAFFGGSTVATFAQGAVVGAYIQGFETANRVYVGGPFDWLTPFSVLTGLGMIAGYALLGSTWTILKTEGRTQDWAYRVAPPLLAVVLGVFAVIGVWTPIVDGFVRERWFGNPGTIWLCRPSPWAVPCCSTAPCATARRGCRSWPPWRCLSPPTWGCWRANGPTSCLLSTPCTRRPPPPAHSCSC